MARWASAAGAWLAVSAVVLAQPSGGPPPALVAVEAARLERVEARREVIGEIRAVRRAALASQEGGLVVAIDVVEGQWVEAGRVLARLDDRLRALDVDRRAAGLRSAEATVAERRAQVEKAQRDLRRLQEVQRRDGASQNEVDDAATRVQEEEARLATAQSDAESARVEHETARKRLSDMTIRAPFAGSIIGKSVEVGEWVDEGDSVVEVIAIDAVDAFLDVPERFTGALLSPDARVVLKIPAIGREIEATVSSVMAAGDRLARTFPVRVRIENGAGDAGGGLLRPGMSVVGLVPTGEPIDALTVHKDSIMRNDAGAYVYFDAGGAAAVAPVEPQYAFGERMVVRSPVLKSEMRVITRGNERVFPGQPLQIVGEPETGRAPSADAEGKGG